MGVVRALRHQYFPRKAKYLSQCEKLLSDGVGLEIGGPSDVFKASGVLPVYPIIKKLDNCNFSDETTWEGVIDEGMTVQYGDQASVGRQYISEASDLNQIQSASYDFVLSSHVIEHVANPLQGLSEWLRVLKQGGILVLLVPHKDGTFDHRRPVTPLDHLIEDYQGHVQEDDLTHLAEILQFHDLGRDPEAGDFENFKRRSERNVDNRCLHHHAFDSSLVAQVLSHLNLKILSMEATLPAHVIAIAQKVESGQTVDNQRFVAANPDYLRGSPFRSDKVADG
jgi:predicted SAM-dependent methyltransferase